MSYTALYRKFRPQNFNDVKGQDHIVTTLRNQLKMNRLGHAYLFCGTRGTGKTTVAKILARAANCLNPLEDGSLSVSCHCDEETETVEIPDSAFGLPIVALRAAAVPETMGRGGLLLDDPDPAAAAAAIDRVVRDESLRQAVRKEQEKRLAQFSYEAVSRRMRQLIGKMIGEG